MIDTILGFEPPIARLFELANTSLDPKSFRRACERFAPFDGSSSDDDLWYFSIPGGPSLIVGLAAEGCAKTRQLAVSRTIMSFCWWETFLKSQHQNGESWQVERAQFDRFYDGFLATAIHVLGAPRVQGADEDDTRHRHAIWRGETGLLILQQSAFDPQFGFDVNYWIQPWSGSDPRPTSPFINWLGRLSSRHAQELAR